MIDSVEKIVDMVYDYAEDECNNELFSIIPVSSSELNVVRAVTRIRKSKMFRAVTYEKDGDEEGKYNIKVTYIKKKGSKSKRYR